MDQTQFLHSTRSIAELRKLTKNKDQKTKHNAQSTMTDIVLTTLNARYQHSAFGLRYLRANLGELQDRSVILEFGLKESATVIVIRTPKKKPQNEGAHFNAI